jgi:hypothetical protein
MQEALIHIPVRQIICNFSTSIQSPTAFKLLYGVPGQVARYLKVRMKLPMSVAIYCAGRKYNRQLDWKVAALRMEFAV